VQPSKLKKYLWGAAMLVLLVSVFFSQQYLNTQREVMGLTRIAPLENAPPVLAFTTKALGGFRGLIANALWIRATELQEEGKYFEMVQLADWITKLEPNLPAVWVHLAWNMSYNISIKFNDYADRWMWVERGITLLRDEALKYNPKEPDLYRELGWHFQHKLGAYLDDAHQYYKYQWAQEMTAVLGSGHPNWDDLINPKTPEQRERVRILREKYKLDPQLMKVVDEHYGPLEWRLPDAHAIYWAVKGLQLAKDQPLRKEQLIGLRRIIFQSLQLAFMRGRLIYPDKKGTEFVYGPNLDIVKTTSDAYVQQAEVEPDKRDNILNAHKNFLGTAVYHLYTHNRRKDAQHWFEVMKQMYPRSAAPNMTLDDYALSRIQEDIGETDPNRVKTIIEGALATAYMNESLGDPDSYDVGVNHELFAKKLWQRYMKEVTPYDKDKGRVSLPPFELIQKEVLDQLLDPNSENALDPLLAAQLRTAKNLPADYGIPATNAPPASIAAPPKKPAAR
jgi:hypothetical protein